MRPLRLVALAISLACAAPASADSWASPVVTEVFSADRAHFVRVTPGDSMGDVVGFAGSPKGRYATAEYYARQADRSYRLTQTVTLPNPVAPARFFVSNDGHLVTLDNWHNMGFGKVLAVYDASGKPVRSYTLEQLFPKKQIDAFPHSVSSIHWYKGPVYLNQDQRTLYMMITDGHDLVLGLQTGRFAYCETRATKFVCRTSADGAWRPYAEAVPAR